jgi:hypothetical protein
MCPTPDSTLADPQEINADLQRQLAECRAERDEALARETAMADVLQVINSSPGDLAPVFDAMLEKAMRLCEAAFGMLWTFDSNRFHMAAHQGVSAELEDVLRKSAERWSIELSDPQEQKGRPGEGSGLRRLLDGEDVWQLADTASEPLQSGVGLRAALVPWRRQ